MSRLLESRKQDRMKEINLKNKEKERLKEREREARSNNGHLFTSITVSSTTLCSSCNRSITAKEALSCPETSSSSSLRQAKVSPRMNCADILAEVNNAAEWTVAKAVFNGTVTGTVLMRQMVFADGSSSDMTLEVTLQSATVQNTAVASLFITNNRIGANSSHCNSVGDVYNPFNMTSMSSSCTLDIPLSCVVGEVSVRHGPVSLTEAQLYTDSIIQLSGDNTVVHRSLALRNGDVIIGCADILPESPSAEQSFPSVPSFSRYDFRRRVADVLQLEIARITILPNSPQSAVGGRCQKVNFMVSGDISKDLLNSIKTSKKMGAFRESDSCTSSAGLLLVSEGLLSGLMFAAAYMLQYL